MHAPVVSSNNINELQIVIKKLVNEINTLEGKVIVLEGKVAENRNKITGLESTGARFDRLS